MQASKPSQEFSSGLVFVVYVAIAAGWVTQHSVAFGFRGGIRESLRRWVIRHVFQASA
jgi:hypothetical protein